jgi:uncharacterized protein YbdZ (MbtH family)
MILYGTPDKMYSNANAVYKVTNSEGRKMIYYMFIKFVSTNSKWPNSKKIPKGWYCAVYPGEGNMKDKSITYEYPEINLASIEDTWFHVDIKNYQQIKYEPYEVVDDDYSQNDEEEDYESSCAITVNDDSE